MRLPDILFPVVCVGCGKTGSYFCSKCLTKVHFSDAICPMCTKPAVDGMTHVICTTVYGMDGLTALWKYEGVIKKGIGKLKYNFASDLASEIAVNFVSSLKKADKPLPQKGAILVPIPLHNQREQWRGFNHASVIGKKLAQSLGWRYCDDLLIRHTSTSAQATLAKDERLKNMKGVFRLNPKYKRKLDQKDRIVLFDDVWTTGATMREAAKVLKRNKAGVVWGVTLAH